MTNSMSIGSKAIILATALTVSIFSVTSLNIAHASTADIQKSQYHGKGKMRNHMKKMMRKLDLSEEQKSQVKAIFSNAKTTKESFKEDIRAYKEQERLLITADELDEAAFTSLRLQYAQVFSNIALEKAKMKHAVKQVLTTEQQEKMQKLRERRGKKLSD